MSLPIYIGYDPRESIAVDVLADSIRRHASIAVDIRPLVTDEIPIFTRPRDPKQSTDFAFSRFLVPYLVGYEGYAVFMDCDMLMRADIAELMAEVNPDAAVSVCQHDYVPKTAVKFGGAVQTPYPRKNWSSLMVFNAPKCRTLTPYYVNRASAADLHQLAWAKDHIGALSLDWNWLVGEYEDNPDARCWHWTLLGPWWVHGDNVPHADEWRTALARMRQSEL